MRNRPARFNLGDFLCTPLHFFDFGVKEQQIRIPFGAKIDGTVLGGGAYNDLGLSQNVDFRSTVLWGVGSSLHGKDAHPTKATNLPYLLYGVRDIDAVEDDKHFLPCVTCMHPNASIKPGEETSVFLNFDKGITDYRHFKNLPLFREGGVSLLSNNLSEAEFLKEFSKTKRVITNSFHVAYWSLLSGRAVSIIGYSTKFRSLLRMAAVDEGALHHYDVSDQASLENLISDILRKDLFINVNNSSSLRNDCIERNLSFATECVKIGFVPQFKIKEHTPSIMKARHIRYLPVQAFEYIRKSR